MAALPVHKGVRAPDGQPEGPALHRPREAPLTRSGREACRHESRQLGSLGAHGLGLAVRGLASFQDLPQVVETPPKGPSLFWLEIKRKRSPQVPRVAASHPVQGVPRERGSLPLLGLRGQQLSHQGSHQPRGAGEGGRPPEPQHWPGPERRTESFTVWPSTRMASPSHSLNSRPDGHGRRAQKWAS